MALNFKIDSDWTLFLDRDGVINQERPGDYVNHWHQFVFNEGVLAAMPALAARFKHIIVITNQRGVGRGITSLEDLQLIHQNMKAAIEAAGGRLDAIYFCPDADKNSPNRKPNPGMALQAREAFPTIDFSKTVMVGNAPGDMGLAVNIGAVPVFLTTTQEVPDAYTEQIAAVFHSLAAFTKALQAN